MIVLCDVSETEVNSDFGLWVVTWDVTLQDRWGWNQTVRSPNGMTVDASAPRPWPNFTQSVTVSRKIH